MRRQRDSGEASEYHGRLPETDAILLIRHASTERTDAVNIRRYLVPVLCTVPAAFCSTISEGAPTPCVDNLALAQAALGPASAKLYYMECAVVTDGFHSFMVRLPAERRAAATERLKNPTAQTLACTATPRDPEHTGLPKKEMVVLTACKPARVSEVWALP